MGDMSWANVNWNNINKIREENLLGKKRRQDLEDAEFKRQSTLQDAIKLEQEKARIETSGKEALLSRILGGGAMGGNQGITLPQTPLPSQPGSPQVPQINASPQPVFRPKGFSFNDSGLGINFERMPSDEEFKQEMSRYAEKETVKGEAMADRERLKKRKEADVNFEIARNKLRTTASAFKAMQQHAEQKTPNLPFLAPNTEQALSATFGGTKVGRLMNINPYTKAYQGQLVEAASSLAKLAAPSARVGKDIIEQFIGTLPDTWSISNPGEFYNQIRFSLHNAFGTALANAGELYTEDVRNKVDIMVDELMNVSPMTVDELNKLNQGLSIDRNYSDGQQPQQPVFGQQQTGKYQVGQVISLPDGRKARIIGGDMNDPDVELIQ